MQLAFNKLASQNKTPDCSDREKNENIISLFVLKWINNDFLPSKSSCGSFTAHDNSSTTMYQLINALTRMNQLMNEDAPMHQPTL